MMLNQFYLHNFFAFVPIVIHFSNIIVSTCLNSTDFLNTHHLKQITVGFFCQITGLGAASILLHVFKMYCTLGGAAHLTYRRAIHQHTQKHTAKEYAVRYFPSTSHVVFFFYIGKPQVF